MIWWEIGSVFDGIRDEYRGWHKFRQATGTWPTCSILADVFSIPAWLVAGTYLFVKTLNTGHLSLIYTALFVGVIGGAALWYGLRRLTCKIDVARARRSGETMASAKTLEEFIR
jgi:hypothetical protein